MSKNSNHDFHMGYNDAINDHYGGFNLSNVSGEEIDAALFNVRGEEPHPEYAAGYKAFVAWLRSTPSAVQVAFLIFNDDHYLSAEYDVQDVFAGQPAKDKWRFCYEVAREAINNGILST